MNRRDFTRFSLSVTGLIFVPKYEKWFHRFKEQEYFELTVRRLAEFQKDFDKLSLLYIPCYDEVKVKVPIINGFGYYYPDRTETIICAKYPGWLSNRESFSIENFGRSICDGDVVQLSMGKNNDNSKM